MGWKDAPLVQATAGKWKDAPLVDAAPAASSGELRPEVLAAFESGKLDRRPIGEQVSGFSNALTTAATEGMTLGFADELGAGIETPFRVIGDLATGRGFDPGRAFNEGLEGQRAYIKQERDKNPTAAAFGDLTGSIATGGAFAKGGLTLMNGAKSLPGLVARGAAEGAAYGGVGGFGRSEAEDVGGRLVDAGTGALTGAVTGGAMTGVLGALAARSAKGKVPTVDDLKSAAGDKYEAAKASGVQADQAKTIALSDKMHDIAVGEGLVSPTGRIDPSYAKLVEALKTFDDYSNGTMSVKQMQAVRKKLQGAAGSADKNERRIAKIMLDEMDNFTSGLAPELREGDALYSTAMRAKTIEKAIKRAEIKSSMYSNGGMENALRTEFRRLSLQIEEGALKGFSPDEIAAIRKVADGGPLENVLRYIGKAAPTGIVSAGLSTGVPFAIGSAIGGPGMGAAAAGATMAAGIGGRAAASALTGSNAVKAALLARSGGKVPKVQLPPAVLRALIGATAAETGSLAQQPSMPRLPQMAY